MSVQTDFNAAYKASQPPPLQELPVTEDQAVLLAKQGFIIDVPIMVWGWDPYLVMKLRSDYGYTWVPSALQPGVSIAPGLGAPGATPYDPNNPPAGSIKVSLNLSDYPPFGPSTPVPPPQAPTVDFVGPQSIGNLYVVLKGDPTPPGATVTDSRGTFIKMAVTTPFGQSVHYEKVS